MELRVYPSEVESFEDNCKELNVFYMLRTVSDEMYIYDLDASPADIFCLGKLVAADKILKRIN